MRNLVRNEKFGINYALEEAQFGTGRGIRKESVFEASVPPFKDLFLHFLL